MNQLSLLSDIPNRLHWLKDQIVYSLSFDQDKILRDIMLLYLDGQPFDVDPTYSTGAMWKKLPQPRLKYDINPQRADVVQADSRSLPLDGETINSILFDPPFIPSISPGNAGKIKARFSSFKNMDTMLAMYELSLREFWRVLTPGGVVAFKCQDGVSSGINHFVHVDIINFARAIGFKQLDLFILGSKRVLVSSRWISQKHARKNHSFILVLRKPKRGKAND